MRQKIQFDKDIAKGTLTVLESSEVDPGIVMPLHEEAYDLSALVDASSQGSKAFAQALRRRSFFPTADLIEKLYQGTVAFFKDKKQVQLIIEYDDAEAFPQEEKFQLEDDDVEIDKILEEDGDTNEDEIKEIDSGDDTPRFTPEDTSEHEN